MCTSAQPISIGAYWKTSTIHYWLDRLVSFWHISGSVRGSEVIGANSFTVSTQGICFEWKGYGLKVHVLEESLPVGKVESRVNIEASISGQFQLPEDSDLLSPIFWISAPFKFTKPVTLEIQHCALTEDGTVFSDLSFVSAKCSESEHPYIFKQLEGGVFPTHRSYGSIQLCHFSGIGITGRKRTPRSYCAYLYHTMKMRCDWRYYFIITQDLDAKIMVHKLCSYTVYISVIISLIKLLIAGCETVL